MLDLNQVRTFLAVVDHAGFSRAAHALETKQPVISQQVRRLEADLGRRLLARSHAKTVPTSDGLRFLPYARALVRTEARARASIENGTLTVAASSNIGTYLLPNILSAYRSQTAAPAIELLIGTNTDAAHHIESGTADIALMEWWDGRSGFDAQIWAREDLVVIVASSHPWAARQSIRKDDLFGETLIGGEAGTGTGHLLQELFGASSKDLKVGLTLGSTAAVKEAVKAGLGISIVMSGSVREDAANGFLVPLPFANATLVKDLYAVLPSDQPETSDASAFGRYLAEAG